MTKEEFEKIQIPPSAKLILWWACTRPPHAHFWKDVCAGLHMAPYEAELAIEALKHPLAGFADRSKTEHLLVRGDHPARKPFGTYIEKPAPKAEEKRASK